MQNIHDQPIQLSLHRKKQQIPLASQPGYIPNELLHLGVHALHKTGDHLSYPPIRNFPYSLLDSQVREELSKNVDEDRMMYIQCIQDCGFEDQLSKDSLYSVRQIGENSYLIENDNKEQRWYGRQHFSIQLPE